MRYERRDKCDRQRNSSSAIRILPALFGNGSCVCGDGVKEVRAVEGVLNKKDRFTEKTVKCNKCNNPNCKETDNYCTNCGNQLNVRGLINPSTKYFDSEPQISQ